MGGFSACNFNVSRDTKITRSRVGSRNTSVGSVGSHRRFCVDHLTLRYQLLLTPHFLVGRPLTLTWYFHFFRFSRILLQATRCAEVKSLPSIWMAPEYTCQLAVRAWNTYHGSVTIESIDSSMITLFRSLYWERREQHLMIRAWRGQLARRAHLYHVEGIILVSEGLPFSGRYLQQWATKTVPIPNSQP